MQRYLRLISIFLLLLSSMTGRSQGQVVADQQPLRDSIGCKMKYATTIEMPKSYLSGITLIVREAKEYRGVMFNEFGITALAFSYKPETKRIKLIHLIDMLDNWLIRRVLKQDLQRVMENLLKGVSTYKNERLYIEYTFSVMCDDSKPKAKEGDADANE